MPMRNALVVDEAKPNESRSDLFLPDSASDSLYQTLQKTIYSSFQMRIDKQIGLSTAHFDTFEI